ncbi:unnamed protein product [Brassicogethes aeneus]|uniref:ESF1 homolog n=1 Tax=Brassicogethes aeneus TaxID=1431903 RepID=A0A9P0BCL9_BRAAE|nr:unnamed protein product [Brassicogethes aeneus]
MEDKRFAHIANDPKFRRIPKNEKKVKIDKRFQGMFSDSKFKVKYTTDKRGRPVNHTSTEDLKRYYELSDEDSDSEESENEEEKGKFVKAPKEEENELKKKIKHDSNLTNAVKSKLKNLKVDYARGESKLFSESSSDDDSDDEAVSEDEDIDHKWGELDAEAESTEEATNRLAVCNMDWDRIRAVDLLVLFNSFLPPGGVAKCVTIYPSEFGKKRMAEEEVKGPTELLNAKPDEENDEETEEGSKYHMERLRQYQLNRLKYYYAVVTFDSPNSANKIYTECDGMEYESSATKMDLRFIPDDMTFDDDPKETCSNIPDKYEPRFFTTTALQQAKVDLTWDETNPDRMEIAQKLNSGKIDDVTENDLQNYLAGSSDEEEEDNEESDSENEESNKGNAIDKYKALLQDIEDKEFEKKNKDIQMEVTWGLGLKEETEKMVKKKLEQKEEKTPFQQFLDKKKEKRKEKREQRKKKNDNEDSSEENSDVPSDIDMNDPYFAEEFKNSEFKKKKSKPRKEESHSENEDNGELELLLMNEEDNKKHFNLKKIQDEENTSKSKKKKNKKRQVEETKDDFDVNVDDDRFSALFTSHHFNIDPTDPNFKKTKAMETLITEKLKRRNDDNEEKTNKKPKVEKKSSKNAELSLLVKSVKRKTENFRNK